MNTLMERQRSREVRVTILLTIRELEAGGRKEGLMSLSQRSQFVKRLVVTPECIPLKDIPCPRP